jgi:2-keto-4-pentenoate hydratase/2-oxohepta-3-ene-1,7-dioic acid hydratase in catechol pathway
VKLVRYGANGFEKPGILDAKGRIRDLSHLLGNIDETVLSKDGQKRLAKIDPATLPLVEGSPRLGVPFVGISKFIGIGLNYSDHAAEAGMAVPTEPILFMKATTSINGPDDDVIVPPHSTKLDWEVELGIVIGSTARYVSEEDALAHVAGYVLINDVSERQFQLERGPQWDKGKGCDTFGPIGPWLVTADEIGDPQTLELWLDVNGKPMQRGTTATMVFGCATLVSYCSHYMTLRPGDVIATGTPPGVGMGMKPPCFLKPGDVVTLGIKGLGQQTQKIVSAKHG